jgi:hypothetical protein
MDDDRPSISAANSSWARNAGLLNFLSAPVRQMQIDPNLANRVHLSDARARVAQLGQGLC